MARYRKPTLKFKLLAKGAKLPFYAHDDDAAFDLYSTTSGTIKKGEIKIFPTGIASEIPKGWFVSFRGRGSMSKNGIDVFAGVIDAGYRGEWQVLLANTAGKRYRVKKGDKIAQGILQPAPQAKIVEVKKLSESKRGEGGFGSTGRK
ncbi:dUTP diphosphatase [Patescibacteria group bacterium]|nr:dUTP diphosphatase [Patescibacteria group bacterium]